jgi:hypothetical protein
MKTLIVNAIYHKLGGMIAPAAGAAVAAICLFLQAHWHITFDSATQTTIALGIGGVMTTILNLAVSWYKNGKMVALQQVMGIVAADGGKPDGVLGPVTQAVASYATQPIAAPVAAIQGIPPAARAELFRH